MAEPQKQNENIKEAPLWMWGIALIGLILTLGSIGFLLYEAAFGDSSPPDVTVHLESVVPVRNGFLVQFRAVNDGGTTAQGLKVEGEISKGTERVETSDTTIEYVPAHSERKGGLFFSTDPRQYDLRLGAKGFEKP
jgi:uncharacterized protein (TIGR02588 family)